MKELNNTASVALTKVKSSGMGADGTTGGSTGVPALGEAAIGPRDQHDRRSVVLGWHQSWYGATQGLLRELNPGLLAP